MAISPLALGIGLQGKYDYKSQAALEIARERGRAKAEAAEEAGKEKKRAEIRKMIVNIKPQGLLPVHEKEINDGVADLLVYAGDHSDDFAGVTQMVHNLESRSLAALEQAKLMNSLSRQSYFEGDKDALQAVYTTSDPAVLEDVLLGLPTNIKFDKATRNASVLNSKYKNTPTRIDEILSKGGDRYSQLTGEEEVIDANGKKFVERKFKPEVVDIALNDMLIGDNLQSSNDDYYTELKRQKIALPNLRTDEGRKEFADGRDAFLRKQITDDLAQRGLLLNVTPSKGMSFTYNAPGVEADKTINPASGGDIILKYKRFSKDPQTATPLGNVAVGNYNALLTNNTRMIDVNTGDNINKAQVVDTDFNEMKIFYVTKKAYGDLPAGLIIPNGYVDKAIELGVVEPKILVFGKQKGSSGKSVYFPVDNVALSQMMKTTPKDRPAIEELQNTLENKRKEIAAKLAQRNNQPAPTGNTGTGKKTDFTLYQEYRANKGNNPLNFNDWKKSNKPTK
jgi:hypothetical protein